MKDFTFGNDTDQVERLTVGHVSPSSSAQQENLIKIL